MRDKQIFKLVKTGRLIPITKFFDGKEYVVGYRRKSGQEYWLSNPTRPSELDKKILEREYERN